MNYPEKIKVIEAFNEFILKEKKSEFIGQVFKVESEEDVIKILNAVKKKYYDASHHCYAFKILNGKEKYSDDGEPKNSAGIRLLNAIEHFELVNQLVVVVRFFGGTKLGVGLLGKAYYECAINLLQSSKIITKNLFQKVVVKTDFEHLAAVHHKLISFNSKVDKTGFENPESIECLVKPGILEKLNTEIAEMTGGKSKLIVSKQLIYC